MITFTFACLMSFLYMWAHWTRLGAFPTFHFLFVIVLSFPFLPSLSFSASFSVSVLCETPWSCPPDCDPSSDWWNGVPVCPAPVIRVCGSPPTVPSLISYSNVCAVFLRSDSKTVLGLTYSYQALISLNQSPQMCSELFIRLLV